MQSFKVRVAVMYDDESLGRLLRTLRRGPGLSSDIGIPNQCFLRLEELSNGLRSSANCRIFNGVPTFRLFNAIQSFAQIIEINKGSDFAVGRVKEGAGVLFAFFIGFD